MTRILGVHGIGNHRPELDPAAAAEALALTWALGLHDGLGDLAKDVDLRVAYYAHALYPGETAQSAASLDDLDAAAQQTLLDWVAALGAPVEIAQGALTQPVRQAASWIARRYGLDNRMVEAFVAVFCPEVRRYLAAPDSADRIAARDIVADAIESHAPRIVVAHSLGSVVTYEALWSRPDLRLDLLVTLGSPLAMPNVIFDRLDPAPVDGSGARPPGVARWVNVADRGDLVAVPRWLARHFTDVDADEEGTIAQFDFHKVRNYLGCSTTADLLKPYL